MMNINAKVILKFLCLMGVWSTILICLMKMNTNHVVLQDEDGAGDIKSGRLLLQKETRFQEATSTTTERFIPLDVLIDNRTRKLNPPHELHRFAECRLLFLNVQAVQAQPRFRKPCVIYD